MIIRSMPPASAHLADKPVPAPPPMIGLPAATWPRRRCRHSSRLKMLMIAYFSISLKEPDRSSRSYSDAAEWRPAVVGVQLVNHRLMIGEPRNIDSIISKLHQHGSCTGHIAAAVAAGNVTDHHRP